MARDPYRNYKFEVEIGAFIRAGFTKVSGLSVETEVIDYREGGDNESPRRIPGQTSFGEVTLSRGISVDSDFISWCKKIFDSTNIQGVQGPNDNFRATVLVHLKDKSGERVRTWKLTDAWPSSYKIEDLDASASDVLIEEIVLQIEGMDTEVLV